jgi:hypothetical protein
MWFSLVIGVISIVFSFSINLFIANGQEDWFEMSSLKNKEVTPITAWMHCLLIAFITFATFYVVFDLREEALGLY